MDRDFRRHEDMRPKAWAVTRSKTDKKISGINSKILGCIGK